MIHVNWYLFSDRWDQGLYSDIQLSMFQIYKEDIYDLLAIRAETTQRLSIREHPADGVCVEGLTRSTVSEQAEFLSVLHRGLKNRVSRSISINENSSRSHVIVQLHLSNEFEEDKRSMGNTRIRRSCLSLVDLAGSERVRKSGSIQNDTVLGEACIINRSIAALGMCIQLLAEAGRKGVKPAHVPFRDCKLTRILAEVRRRQRTG